MTVEFEELIPWAEDSSPLYARLCSIAIEDDEVRALADHVPEDRSTANVFLAAVHYLLLRGADHPLRDYYPSVVDDARPPDDDLARTFRDFCLTHAEELVPLLENRRTQTNAVRRSAALYPAFSHVAADLESRGIEGPIAFVELGPSAGLNLLWDRFRYEYDGDVIGNGSDGDAVDGGPRVVGDPDSPVTISSTVRGDRVPPLADEPPAVHSRVGVDLNPMDVTDEGDADWLTALVWPEQSDRRRVLANAIDVARADPPRLVEGDMIAELPGLFEEIPEDVPVVVYSTLVLYQVPDAVRDDLLALLESAMAERPLYWVSGDGLREDSEAITIEWTRSVDGDPATELLGAFKQHGEWIEWQA